MKKIGTIFISVLALFGCSHNDGGRMNGDRSNTLIHVGGDGLFLSIIDAKTYKSFVGQDWSENGKLANHLVGEFKKRTALVWATGFEVDWRIEVRYQSSDETGFREVTGSIINSGDGLYLLNYDSLTMAAQFAHHKLPDEESMVYKIPIGPGIYNVRIIQMLDVTKDGWWEHIEEGPAFVIEITKTEKPYEPWADIPWQKI